MAHDPERWPSISVADWQGRETPDADHPGEHASADAHALRTCRLL